MSLFNLPNEITNSSVGSAEYVDGDKIYENMVRMQSEWQDGTNTDFSIASGEVGSLNTGMSSANTIGTSANTTINADTVNAATLNATSGTGLVPVGSITAYVGTEAPSGWHLCDGSELLVGSYATLYSLIGYAFGSSGEGTYFKLPDLRGYFIRGLDNGAGNDPDVDTRTDRGDETIGDAIGTKQDYAVKEHFHDHIHKIDGLNEQLSHSTNVNRYEIKSYGSGNNTYDTSVDMDSSDNEQVGVNDVDGTSITATTSSASESRPKNIALNYIIRIQ